METTKLIEYVSKQNEKKKYWERTVQKHVRFSTMFHICYLISVPFKFSTVFMISIWHVKKIWNCEPWLFPGIFMPIVCHYYICEIYTHTSFWQISVFFTPNRCKNLLSILGDSTLELKTNFRFDIYSMLMWNNTNFLHI